MLEYVPRYGSMKVPEEHAMTLYGFFSSLKMLGLNDPNTYHVTTIFSRRPFCHQQVATLAKFHPVKLQVLGDSIVIVGYCEGAEEAWKRAVCNGASWDFDQYIPHIAISTDIKDPFNLEIVERSTDPEFKFPVNQFPLGWEKVEKLVLN